MNNKVAAEKLYNEVIREIEKRSSNPESYEKYIGVRKRKNIYYRIYVKNYTIYGTLLCSPAKTGQDGSGR
mgnify:CR=1 FL=1